MKKSKHQIEAEQIVASLIKEATPEEVLLKARSYANSYKYAIAQKVTITILLCTVWDFYEDFNEKMLNELYDQYEAYYASYQSGNENIKNQMLELNELLEHKLLNGKIFNVIRKGDF